MHVLVASTPLFSHRARGFFLMDAIIACAVTLIAGSYLWRVIKSSSALAHATLEASKSECERVSCSAVERGFACSCGEAILFVIK